MKIIIGSFLFLFLLSGCSLFKDQRTKEGRGSKLPTKNVNYYARATPDAPLRQRVVVLPFLDEVTTRSKNITTVARNTVVRELQNTRQFVVVKNSDFPQQFSQFVNEKREYDMLKIASLASNMGVAAIIEGKILEIHAKRIGDEVGVFRKVRARTEVTVRLRVVAPRTGSEVLNTQRTASVEAETTRVMKYTYSDQFLQEDPQLVRAAVQKAFRGSMVHLVKSVQKLDWEGRVASVRGEQIYINAGRLSGIQIGDILRVTDKGDEIFDPENGKFIGEAPGRMKGTLEIVGYYGKDGAIGIIHSGSGFKENDQVELY